MKLNEITEKIIGTAIEVHRVLGPGLLESSYEECLAREFELREINFERQKPLPIVYKDLKLECGYRLDFLVENQIIVELKSVDEINPIFLAQVLTYLRLLDKQVGLLINFNVPVLKNGIKRIVNNYKPE
jgi:GxxExxY protein